MGIKRIILTIDGKYFHGKFKRIVSKYRKKNQEKIYNFASLFHRRIKGKRPIRSLGGKSGREFAVKDILLAQYYNGDYSIYKHEDGAVRLLAIEEYEGKNHFGWDMYLRMQGESFWKERFSKLIASYQGGYDEKSRLELDKCLAVMDGSHRLMLAFHHNQEFINAKILDTLRNRSFDRNFFWMKGFSKEECDRIESKTAQILDACNYDFFGVVWPPAFPFAQTLLSDISMYDPDNVKIIESRDMYLERGDFVHIFKALYHTDVLDEEGMDGKIALVESFLKDEEGGYPNIYPITVFKIRCKKPCIAMNPKNYSAQSRTIKNIKTTFRARYASYIPNYQYDVIIHMTDNYLQSKFCDILFSIDRDISEVFRLFESEPYVVIRAKQSRQHSEFPRKFYFRGDSDIIVRISDMKRFGELAYDFSKKIFAYPWIRVEKQESEDEVKVVIWMRDFMVFQFEFMSRPYGLDMEFAKECLENRINEGDYFILPDKEEIIIRIAEYIHKPKKTWYLDYIRRNIDKLDLERLFRHLDKSEISERTVRKFLTKFTET